jgi:hypothetical protein
VLTVIVAPLAAVTVELLPPFDVTDPERKIFPRVVVVNVGFPAAPPAPVPAPPDEVSVSESERSPLVAPNETAPPAPPAPAPVSGPPDVLTGPVNVIVPPALVNPTVPPAPPPPPTDAPPVQVN